MNPISLTDFRIKVRPSPETNDHEVCLLAGDIDLVEYFATTGRMGLDPDELLVEPCVLRADDSPHVALIGRCSCGVTGCGSLQVKIHREGNCVTWAAADSSRSFQFDARQYDAEIDRALCDHSWETPDRTVGRLLSGAVDRLSLARRGFEFQWASGRCRVGMIVVSLLKVPGQRQVLVGLPWHGQNIEGIVNQLTTVLSQPQQTWPIVGGNPNSR